MPNLSNSSKEKLDTCDPQLIKLVNEAIKYFDFTVICGHRNKEDQDKAVAAGNSKTPWPTSPHNSLPSRAVDLYPYSEVYGLLLDSPKVKQIIAKKDNLNLVSTIDEAKINAYIREEFCRLAQTMSVCAQQLGIEITWGADWDNDGDRLEQSFIDLPHFELKSQVQGKLI
jgi:hypothetical protein